MADKSLTFNLFGRDVSASKTVGEFSDKAGYSIESLSGRLAGLAGGFIGVSSVINFGKDAVDASMAAQLATEKLNVALKNTHSGFTANSQAVDEQKSKLLDFGYTGAQTSDALRVLTTGVGSGTKALGLMQVTADLAKYKNIDLASAALIVAKGFEGQIRPLKQLGIDLPVYNGTAQQVALAQQKVAKAHQAVNDLLAKYPDAADKASKHNAAYEAAVKKVADAQQVSNDKADAGKQIIDALSKKLSGEASKSAETYAGKWDKVNAKFDETKVHIGNVLEPALSGLADEADAVFTQMDDVQSGHLDKMKKDSASYVADWDVQITKIQPPFVIQSAAVVGSWIDTMTKLPAETQAGMVNMVAKIEVGMGNVPAIFEGAYATIEAETGRAFDSIGSMFGGVVASLENGWAQIQGFITGHPVQGQIQWSNVVPPPPSGGGGGTVIARVMAAGGVVRARPGGMPAIVAEAGSDEAVLPLNDSTYGKLASAIVAAGGGDSGKSVTNNFTINQVTDTIGTSNAVMRRLNARGAV